MKQNVRILIPAILVIVASIAILVYAQFFMPHPVGHRGGHQINPSLGNGQTFDPSYRNGGEQSFNPGTEERRTEEKRGLSGIFNLLGNLSINLGACCFFWFILKKKLTSPSQMIKKAAKGFFKVHTFVGWTALGFGIVHGVYYLVTDFSNSRTFTGIAAILILLVLGVYGLFIRRVRNKYTRKAHFLLSSLWIPILMVHAGGSVFAMVIVGLLIWGILWFVDSSSKKSTVHGA